MVLILQTSNSSSLSPIPWVSYPSFNSAVAQVETEARLSLSSCMIKLTPCPTLNATHPKILNAITSSRPGPPLLNVAGSFCQPSPLILTPGHRLAIKSLKLSLAIFVNPHHNFSKVCPPSSSTFSVLISLLPFISFPDLQHVLKSNPSPGIPIHEAIQPVQSTDDENYDASGIPLQDLAHIFTHPPQTFSQSDSPAHISSSMPPPSVSTTSQPANPTGNPLHLPRTSLTHSSPSPRLYKPYQKSGTRPSSHNSRQSQPGMSVLLDSQASQLQEDIRKSYADAIELVYDATKDHCVICYLLNRTILPDQPTHTPFTDCGSHRFPHHSPKDYGDLLNQIRLPQDHLTCWACGLPTKKGRYQPAAHGKLHGFQGCPTPRWCHKIIWLVYSIKSFWDEARQQFPGMPPWAPWQQSQTAILQWLAKTPTYGSFWNGWYLVAWFCQRFLNQPSQSLPSHPSSTDLGLQS
jgi:hypothetical protein